MTQKILNELSTSVLKDFFKTEKQGVSLTIKIKPNAFVEKLSLSSTQELLLSVRATASKGEANTRVIEVLSELLSIPKSRIEIISGHTSRIKRLLFHGLSAKNIE
ncbi:MAG: DUF167 domain-containing protein [Myxococcales bacterium]|nr:DUF167 domain-containing protein [Myxococcales bacterium]USN50352.1 MAG: DUF167 domain-containing protein [Myxococcales bacterium]